MIFRIILYGLLFYFLYRLVFDLAIPVYKATRQVRRGFNEMQNRMNGYQDRQDNPDKTGNTSAPSQKPKVGEYIDFEEVK